MNKNNARSLLATGMFLMSAVASAAELTIAPAVDLAYKTSDFTIEFGGGGGGGTDLISPSYMTLTPSLALSYNRFYGVVAYESTVNPWTSSTLEVVPSPAQTRFTNDSFERKEASLTFGYRVFDGSRKIGAVNVFGGYLHGISTWRQTSFITNTTTLTMDILSVGFQEDGYFLGVNYSHSFGNKGTLSLSGAFGLLDGILKDVEVSGSSPTNQDIFAESTGLSLGVGWSGNITGNMNYRVGMKYINYNFDVNSIENKLTGAVVNYPSGQLQIKETIYSLYFGVVNYF